MTRNWISSETIYDNQNCRSCRSSSAESLNSFAGKSWFPCSFSQSIISDLRLLVNFWIQFSLYGFTFLCFFRLKIVKNSWRLRWLKRFLICSVFRLLLKLKTVCSNAQEMGDLRPQSTNDGEMFSEFTFSK